MTSHRRLRPTVPVLAAALLLAGCGGAAEAGTTAGAVGPSAGASAEDLGTTVAHVQGQTVVPVDPEAVLTFDLASLDTLDTLGVEVAGIPKTDLPAAFADLATDDVVDIGTLFEPDYEAVAAAGADLIIVAGRSAAAYPRLAEIAPTIDLSTDAADYLGSIERNAQTLGEIFGRQDEVGARLADLDASIEDLRGHAGQVGTGLIVLTTGGEVTAYGPGSRFGWLHDELGVTPVREDIEEGSHGQAVSFEYLREANPDWLFVIDRDAAIGEGGAAAEQVLDNELVAQTTAWSSDQVVHLDAVDWYIAGGGLGTTQRIVDDVAAALGAG